MKSQELSWNVNDFISKDERKKLTRRNNTVGLMYLSGHLSAIVLSGVVVYITSGTYFIVPAIMVHGMFLACLFAPMHECSHGTAFRSRWLNEAIYWLVSLIYISQPTWYRYRHAVHHTYTQIQGKDPAMVLPSPTTPAQYISQVVGWRFWTTFPVVITRHAFGNMRAADSWYVPASDRRRIYNEARFMLAIYGGVAGAAIWFGSFAPLIYWLIPRMIGEPLQRVWRIAEHKGCEEGPDVRTNTRSTRANPLMQALCWNMPYHSEHHVCPQVPFFRLPELNRIAGAKLRPMGESLLAVDREVRRTCLVSEEEAARIRKERQQAPQDWVCHLD